MAADPTTAAEAAVETATKAREEGNARLREGKLEEAVTAYSRGIVACEAFESEDAVKEALALLLSNRSAAHLRNKANEDALADADACLRRKPTWGKAHGRRGAALLNLGRVQDALLAYEEGIRVDGENLTLCQGAEQCRARLGSSSSSGTATAATPNNAAAADTTTATDTPLEAEPASASATSDAAVPAASSDAEKEKEKEKEEEEEEEEEEDPLASFMNDIESLESDLAQAKARPKAKDATAEGPRSVVDHSKETSGWNASNQLDRILCKNHEWINTNPFQVLGIQNEQATAFDVKKRYHKLSTLVHPDKTTDARAEDAFAEVRRAYERLQDDGSRSRVRAIIEQCKGSVIAEREKLLDKGFSAAEVDEKLGTLDVAIDRKVKLEFATRERERRKNELMKRKYNERELEKEQSEQAYWQSVKKVEENMRETRESRAKTWQSFANAKRVKRKK
ncbi:DnaJ-like subfamily C member 8 [Hondaea fermentalgiana]|uniref:DnaJ-like subfamily C member 8 n=1 Tax=Hondaea fermentalgiana TaxID=2315210 RepID=A0A2R5G6R4_9STRA|nr:DnaJ-like subfamily C member 8 [Hondaea fermentalgiana]|eukprot:GBG26736.1 DnaJ-like subfamily C member 8 [Hondaea fermentalgiana]